MRPIDFQDSIQRESLSNNCLKSWREPIFFSLVHYNPLVNEPCICRTSDIAWPAKLFAIGRDTDTFSPVVVQAGGDLAWLSGIAIPTVRVRVQILGPD